MNPAQKLLHKNRDKAVLAASIILSLVLMILPDVPKKAAAGLVLDVLYLPGNRFLAYVDDLLELRDENLRLRRMVASLLIERERLLQFKEERERLRKLAAFKETQFYKLLPAEVIDRGLDRNQDKLTIDKGRRDSLEVGMPVLSYAGYVGDVSEVREDISVVTIICSHERKVSCMDKRSRVVGILEWKEGERFRLNFVGRYEDVKKGDTLITSGFGGRVPKGFPIAVVLGTSQDDIGLIQDVAAESLVRFNSLEQVFVMLGRVPWDDAVTYDAEDRRILKSIVEDEK